MGDLVTVLYTSCPFTNDIHRSFVKHFQQRFIAWENAFFFRLCDVDDGNPQVFPSLYSSRQAFYVLHRVIFRLQHELQYLCKQLCKQLFQCKCTFSIVMNLFFFTITFTCSSLVRSSLISLSKDYLTGET
ncbi:hypothetical protein HNR77_003265 [Paenibacillus sp. JGP012]|nr:hypothetical protein [Paenibacillus sp. JGP012]